MFCHRLPRHIEVLTEGIEGLAVVLMKLIEQGPAARISQSFEDTVHGPIMQPNGCMSMGDYLGTRVRALAFGAG